MQTNQPRIAELQTVCQTLLRKRKRTCLSEQNRLLMPTQPSSQLAQDSASVVPSSIWTCADVCLPTSSKRNRIFTTMMAGDPNLLLTLCLEIADKELAERDRATPGKVEEARRDVQRGCDGTRSLLLCPPQAKRARKQQDKENEEEEDEVEVQTRRSDQDPGPTHQLVSSDDLVPTLEDARYLS